MAYNSDNDYLYRNYEFNFPRYAERTVSSEYGDAFELIATLDDGTKLAYYDPECSVRILPNINLGMRVEDADKELREYFGYRLERVMWYRNMSQKELSQRLGISQAQVSRYVRGKSTPSFGVIHMIAKILDCSISDLLYKY